MGFTFVSGGKGSHADFRYYGKWKDQHGRPWGGECENKTREPCCGVEPVGVRQPDGTMSAPWQFPYPTWKPSPDCIHVTTDPERPAEIVIDYDTMIQRAKDWRADWNRRLMEVGHKVNGDAFDFGNPGPAVLEIVGAKPVAPEVFVAQKQGNRAALGWDTKTGKPYNGPMDPRLAEFVPVQFHPEPDFSDKLDLSDKPDPKGPEPKKAA